MRVAILGDVHSNREALDAVLRDASRAGVDRILQVGDVVGYGPDPDYCVERLRDAQALVCLGNHDAAVLRRLPLDTFNPFARMAIEWTIFELGREQREWLQQLPMQQTVPDLDATIVHGSLHRPDTFDYVRSLASAVRSLEQQSTRLCFVGHTHQPCLFAMDGDGLCDYVSAFEREGVHRNEGGARLLVNVGSVGQPRDEDPRAAYVLYDTKSQILRLARVEYDIAAVQSRIRARGLPHVLADRLAYGL